jgi:hypothetical protein
MENFNKWLEVNLKTAKQLPLTDLLSQTWYAGFVAGRWYQADHPHDCLEYPPDLKQMPHNYSI